MTSNCHAYKIQTDFIKKCFLDKPNADFYDNYLRSHFYSFAEASYQEIRNLSYNFSIHFNNVFAVRILSFKYFKAQY